LWDVSYEKNCRGLSCEKAESRLVEIVGNIKKIKIEKCKLHQIFNFEK
jgi:hypothetical protein